MALHKRKYVRSFWAKIMSVVVVIGLVVGYWINMNIKQPAYVSLLGSRINANINVEQQLTDLTSEVKYLSSTITVLTKQVQTLDIHVGKLEQCIRKDVCAPAPSYLLGQPTNPTTITPKTNTKE